MQARRAGGNHNAIQVLLENVLFDALLSRLGTGIRDVLRNHHIFEARRRFGDFGAIDGLGDVQSAVADINPDARLRT